MANDKKEQKPSDNIVIHPTTTSKLYENSFDIQEKKPNKKKPKEDKKDS